MFLAVSFFCYGVACFFSQHMITEFSRYGVPQFRKLIGTLEIAGALGLIFGYFVPILQFLAALGLGTLMLSGCVLRIKIRDRVIQIIPASTFLLISSYVVIKILQR